MFSVLTTRAYPPRPRSCGRHMCRSTRQGKCRAGQFRATKACGQRCCSPADNSAGSGSIAAAAAVAAPAVACCHQLSHPQDLGGQVHGNDASRAAHATCKQRCRRATGNHQHDWHALRCAPGVSASPLAGATPFAEWRWRRQQHCRAVCAASTHPPTQPATAHQASQPASHQNTHPPRL